MRDVEKMLSRLQGRVSFHMPGHKGLIEGGAFDTTELPISDDLHEPTGAYRALAEKIAGLYGAKASFALVGGSTLGVQAMLLSFLRPGDKLIMQRNSHVSAYSACILGGFEPVFPKAPDVLFDEMDDFDEARFLDVMWQNPDARAVFITRPNYYGKMPNLRKIVACARELQMKVLVDEAHGAHLRFYEEDIDAGACGADAWCQSLHKTLPALTQTALLHIKEEGMRQGVRDALRLLQTSSPSSLLVLSIEQALGRMRTDGRQLLHDLKKKIAAFEQGLSVDGRYRGVSGENMDPFRLIIDVRGTGKSGYAVNRELASLQIDMEMADGYRIIGIPSVLSTEQDFDHLLNALLEIKGKGNYVQPDKRMAYGKRILTMREAFFAEHEYIPLQRAAGRICARSFGAYPPGIPFVVPGEEITQDVLAAMSANMEMGGESFGTREDGGVACVITR